jgi:hypothetical protein
MMYGWMNGSVNDSRCMVRKYDQKLDNLKISLCSIINVIMYHLLFYSTSKHKEAKILMNTTTLLCSTVPYEFAL